jgi:hypothetical protein
LKFVNATHSLHSGLYLNLENLNSTILASCHD